MENETIKALHEENMSVELSEHIAGCPACQDIVAVRGWMHRFKEAAWVVDMTEKILPDAEIMWNRVYAPRRPDKKLVRKALRPLLIPQAIFYGLLISGIIAMTIWGFNKLGDVMDDRVASLIPLFFGIMLMIVLISLSFCAVVEAFDRRKHPI